MEEEWRRLWRRVELSGKGYRQPDKEQALTGDITGLLVVLSQGFTGIFTLNDILIWC